MECIRKNLVNRLELVRGLSNPHSMPHHPQPPHGRSIVCVWTVTKWFKDSQECLLDSVKGIFQADRSVRDEPMGRLERQIHVRFECTQTERCGTKEAGRTGTELTIGLGVGGGSKNASRRNTVLLRDFNNPPTNSPSNSRFRFPEERPTSIWCSVAILPYPTGSPTSTADQV